MQHRVGLPINFSITYKTKAGRASKTRQVEKIMKMVERVFRPRNSNQPIEHARFGIACMHREWRIPVRFNVPQDILRVAQSMVLTSAYPHVLKEENAILFYVRPLCLGRFSVNVVFEMWYPKDVKRVGLGSHLFFRARWSLGRFQHCFLESGEDLFIPSLSNVFLTYEKPYLPSVDEQQRQQLSKKQLLVLDWEGAEDMEIYRQWRQWCAPRQLARFPYQLLDIVYDFLV